MVSPCETCLQPGQLNTLSTGLSGFIATLEGQIAASWEFGSAFLQASAEGDMTPSERAKVDQQRETVLDHTPKMEIIVHDAMDAINTASSEAKAIVCGDTSCIKVCPRLAKLATAASTVSDLAAQAQQLYDANLGKNQ